MNAMNIDAYKMSLVRDIVNNFNTEASLHKLAAACRMIHDEEADGSNELFGLLGNKPYSMQEIDAWLNEAEADIEAGRTLAKEEAEEYIKKQNPEICQYL